MIACRPIGSKKRLGMGTRTTDLPCGLRLGLFGILRLQPVAVKENGRVRHPIVDNMFLLCVDMSVHATAPDNRVVLFRTRVDEKERVDDLLLMKPVSNLDNSPIGVCGFDGQ
jgi:hypothetical protein